MTTMTITTKTTMTTKTTTNSRQHAKEREREREMIKEIREKYRTKRYISIEQNTRHDTCVSHKLHPVYIVRTMICSYFGISFFGFAKNVYLQILYENIYRKKKTEHEI